MQRELFASQSSERIKPEKQEGNACGLLMCMWMRDLADYALNNM